MGWVPDNVIAALSQSHQLGIFLRVGTVPPLHIWFGVNDIPIGFDSIDEDGTVYLGGGRLVNVPTLEVLVNGTSDAVEFTIAGIDPAMGAKMLESIPPVRGAPVQLGITTLDDYYQPMSKIIPIWRGTASHTGESSVAVQGTQSPTLTLSLAVVSGESMRSRPALSTWSHAQQYKSHIGPRPPWAWLPNPDYDPEGATEEIRDPLLRDEDGNHIPDWTLLPGDETHLAGYDGEVPLFYDRFCDATARLARGVAPAWPNF